MKYIIEYSLSFGAKECSTCNGSGLIFVENDAGDKMGAVACPRLTCFDSGSQLYTEPRFIISGKRSFTSEHALTNFCERLHRIKMGLAFHYAGEVYRDLRSAYQIYRGGFQYNKQGNFGYSELNEVGLRVVEMLPYHNKLKVEIYRKP